ARRSNNTSGTRALTRALLPDTARTYSLSPLTATSLPDTTVPSLRSAYIRFPISLRASERVTRDMPHSSSLRKIPAIYAGQHTPACTPAGHTPYKRSEEHTSELQSRENLECSLLLEKKK